VVVVVVVVGAAVVDVVVVGAAVVVVVVVLEQPPIGSLQPTPPVTAAATHKQLPLQIGFIATLSGFAVVVVVVVEV
jgi:hypothetical protein